MSTLKEATAAAIAAIQAAHDLTIDTGRPVSVRQTYDALNAVAEFVDELIEGLGEALDEEEES